MISAEVYREVFANAVPGMLAGAAEAGREQFNAVFATCCTLLVGIAVTADVEPAQLLKSFGWPPRVEQLFAGALDRTDTTVLTGTPTGS